MHAVASNDSLCSSNSSSYCSLNTSANWDFNNNEQSLVDIRDGLIISEEKVSISKIKHEADGIVAEFNDYKTESHVQTRKINQLQSQFEEARERINKLLNRPTYSIERRNEKRNDSDNESKYSAKEVGRRNSFNSLRRTGSDSSNISSPKTSNATKLSRRNSSNILSQQSETSTPFRFANDIKLTRRNSSNMMLQHSKISSPLTTSSTNLSWRNSETLRRIGSKENVSETVTKFPPKVGARISETLRRNRSDGSEISSPLPTSPKPPNLLRRGSFNLHRVGSSGSNVLSPILNRKSSYDQPTSSKPENRSSEISKSILLCRSSPSIPTETSTMKVVRFLVSDTDED